jgi:hypothetical protein
MTNDRAFIAYAMALVLGISIVITTMIWIGTGQFPAALFVIEHVSLGLLIRGSYKSFDGPYGIFDTAKTSSEATEVAEPAFGPTADPVS